MAATMDYTTLSLVEVTKELYDIARDTQDTFGGLDDEQLNWKPDARRWSVAQCFQHLLTANRLVLDRAEHALRNPPGTLWQRVPLLPALWGHLLIRSQGPGVARKFTAPVSARPTASQIPADIIERFVAQQRVAAEWMRSLREDDAAERIMISPFIGHVTYSVLNGCRLVVAHDRRHFEQARRVMAERAFPRRRTPVAIDDGAGERRPR
jgi:hypothetical protein